MKRKIGFPLLTVLLVVLLAGCGSRTVEEMYSLPRRSPKYHNLQTVIDNAMAGLEYAAPVSGENRQSVQIADLDGDGTDEYLVFAKGAGETPLRVLIFRQTSGDNYELMEEISCKGTAFEQVQYVEFDGNPGDELVVGKRINDQVTRIASVYSFAEGQSEQILSTIYAKYITVDLNRDERTELMVIRNGEAEAANAVAVLYGYRDGEVDRSVEVSLSVKADQIKRITTNFLSGEQTAVYVAGAMDEETLITDVLAMKKSVFTNVALSSELGTSVQTMRNYFIYAQDIDEDGILELPSLVPMRLTSESEDEPERNLIRWYSLNIDGKQIDKLYTYHDYAGGWYMELERSWINRIAVGQNGAANTFYMWNENYGQAMAVFTVFTLTGKDRDSQAAVQNRFALYRGDSVVYAGKLESASAIYGITDSYLTRGFHLIHQDWKAGEL